MTTTLPVPEQTHHEMPQPTPASGPPPAPTRPSRGRRAAELGVTALLAAAIASGTTLAVDRTLADEGAPGTSPGPVVEGANGATTDWSAVAASVSPSVVSIGVSGQRGQGEGSGVVWDAEGHIVTNDHVVSGSGASAEVQVTLADGRTYDAIVTGTDPTTDLAVVRLTSPPTTLRPITRGDSETLTVGDPVMAIGNPLGLSGTVTTGIVSALDRPVAAGQSRAREGLAQVTNAIQTSAPINPGNSGGALVDAEGGLVGINSSIATLGSPGPFASGQAGNIGIGFAIPVAQVEGVVSQLIESGSVEHAYLGISTSDTSVRDGTSSVPGALVAETVSDGPAATEGLRSGDVITAIDGAPVTSSRSLVGTIRARAVGEQVELTVSRGSETVSVPVTLAAAPSR
ncbi:MAG: PDZ domain-containing protein [Intrasporangiaceae bacterium]|nr:PDZ domain-containing protein [Intrasporangiaceae bacterium]